MDTFGYREVIDRAWAFEDWYKKLNNGLYYLKEKQRRAIEMKMYIHLKNNRNTNN